MLVTFTGNPNDARDVQDAITFWGVKFPLGVPVLVPDEWTDEQRRRIARNNHFSVEADAQSEPETGSEPQDDATPVVPKRRGRKSA